MSANQDHGTRAPNLLGRTRTVTLTLKSNGNGVYFEISPPDAQTVRDISVILARRMNFAFSVAAQGKQWKQEGAPTVPVLLDVNLAMTIARSRGTWLGGRLLRTAIGNEHDGKCKAQAGISFCEFGSPLK